MKDSTNLYIGCVCFLASAAVATFEEHFKLAYVLYAAGVFLGIAATHLRLWRR